MRRVVQTVLTILAAASLAASSVAGPFGTPDGSRHELHPSEQTRVVAVGDVHGAFEGFTAILKKAGLIDERHRWAGGKAVLVQTGDVSDRGEGMRAALDLLMSLEPQASRAGGRVHPLLGNHEVMNLVGDTRDATPEIFASFGGEVEMREAFGPRGRYGRWLRSKAVIAEVDDTIFLHGGINPDFSNASTGEINRRARRELAQWDEGVKWLVGRKLVSPSPKFLEAVEAARKELERLSAPELRDHADTPATAALLFPIAEIGMSSLFSPDGPLWFRGFSTWTEEEGDARITAVLAKLRAKRIVTGHTVQETRRITDRFGGRLFLIDTGMLGGRFFPSGRASALEILGGTPRPLYLD
jgi:hypothetical protein